METREADEAVRRRRECEACKLRFTTYERPQFPRLAVRAASGAQRNFTRGWLAGALRLAGPDLPDAALKTIVAGVEAQLRATGKRVVSTGDVAALAAREVGQSSPYATAGVMAPTADRLALVLEAALPARRAPAQLPLPFK